MITSSEQTAKREQGRPKYGGSFIGECCTLAAIVVRRKKEKQFPSWFCVNLRRQWHSAAHPRAALGINRPGGKKLDRQTGALMRLSRAGQDRLMRLPWPTADGGRVDG